MENDKTSACEHPKHPADCPDGCAAPYVCVYCGAEAVEERFSRESGFKESVCEQCSDDLNRLEKHARREEAREAHGDYLYDRMKDEGY